MVPNPLWALPLGTYGGSNRVANVSTGHAAHATHAATVCVSDRADMVREHQPAGLPAL